MMLRMILAVAIGAVLFWLVGLDLSLRSIGGAVVGWLLAEGALRCTR